MTNADVIRSMTDEELFEFLRSFEDGDIDYAITFCDLCTKDAALERRSCDCDGLLNGGLCRTVNVRKSESIGGIEHD